MVKGLDHKNFFLCIISFYIFICISLSTFLIFPLQIHNSLSYLPLFLDSLSLPPSLLRLLCNCFFQGSFSSTTSELKLEVTLLKYSRKIPAFLFFSLL